MNFAIYCRKSKFTGRGESIENQLDYCKRYIDLTFKDTVPHQIFTYFDEGYSGKNLERPSFKEMLQDCYLHKLDYVVVYRLDRISRNVSDFSNLYQKLLDLNIGFISTSEHYDTSTSGGRAMLFMACVFAQLERETVSERVKDNMYSLAKTGRWLGGYTPTGFTSISSTKDKRIQFKLNPNEDISIVKLIFNKYIETLNISSVEGYLFENKVKSPNCNYYSKSSIKTLLENPVYCQSDIVSFEYLESLGCNMFCSPKDCNGNGYITYGKTSTNGGKVQKRMSTSNWIVSIGEHKGIVSGIDWVMVQKSLHRANYKTEVVHNSNSLLSGYINCPICNSKMISRTKTSTGFVYACSLKLQQGTKACKSKSIDGSLDDILVENIFSLATPNKDVISQLEDIKKNIHSSSADIQKDILLKRLSKSKKLLLNLDNTSELFKEVSSEYEETFKSLNIWEETSKLDTSNLEVRKILLEGFKSLPIQQRRNFMKDIVCNVQILD